MPMKPTGRPSGLRRMLTLLSVQMVEPSLQMNSRSIVHDLNASSWLWFTPALISLKSLATIPADLDVRAASIHRSQCCPSACSAE